MIYAAVRSVINTRLAKKGLAEGTKTYIQLDYFDEEGNYHAIPMMEKKKEKQQFSLKQSLKLKEIDKSKKENESEAKDTMIEEDSGEQ